MSNGAGYPIERKHVRGREQLRVKAAFAPEGLGHGYSGFEGDLPAPHKSIDIPACQVISVKGERSRASRTTSTC